MNTHKALQSVRKAFKESGPNAIAKQLYFKGPARRLIKTWIATFVYIAIPISIGFTAHYWLSYATAITLAFIYYKIIEKTRRESFKEEYEKYNISSYSFGKSAVMLHYANFSKKMQTLHLTITDIKFITDWIDIEENPQTSTSFFNSPIVGYLISLPIALFVEVVKNPFNSKTPMPANWLISCTLLSISMLSFISGISSLFMQKKEANLRLIKFLRWHSIDTQNKTNNKEKND